MCLPLGIRYSRGSPPSSGVTNTRRLPRTSVPKDTMPSISETIANSLGLRASKSSATRGRPPVMSLVRVTSRGIFATTSPAATSSPSVADRYAPIGSSLSCSCSAVRTDHRDARPQRGILRLDDHLRRQTGELVHLLAHGLAFDDVHELRGALDLGQERARERIPLEQDFARLHRRGRPATRTQAP